METKNQHYKDLLKRANLKLKNQSVINSKISRTNSKITSIGERSSTQSYLSQNNLSMDAKNVPRKSTLLFMDVRNKLNLISNESEGMMKGVKNIMGNLDRRRSSIQGETRPRDGKFYTRLIIRSLNSIYKYC